jgi:flagellar biosynthesis/type III secretory pathway protein FliH
VKEEGHFDFAQCPEGRREGGKEGRREGGKEGRREGGKEGRRFVSFYSP